MRSRVLLALALSACGDDAALQPGPPPECAARVSDSLIEHACFHAQVGPHQQLELRETIDRPHTAFHVPLGSARSGEVMYRARESGRFAFFTRDVTSLQVWDGARQVPPSIEHDTELCAELPRVSVFALAARSYRLTLQGAAEQVTLVPEQDEEACTLDACRIDPVLEHSCLHIQHGPFAQAAGDIDAPHTVYRLAGSATFTPTRDGEYVFYSSDARALTLLEGSQSQMPIAQEDVRDCAGLARAHVFALRAGIPYRLEPGVGEVTLLVESVTTFSPSGWAARFEPCEE